MQTSDVATFMELTIDDQVEINGGGCKLSELRSETIRGAIRGALSGLVTGTVQGVIVGAVVGGAVEAGDYSYTCGKK
jgi:hypothetical protein